MFAWLANFVASILSFISSLVTFLYTDGLMYLRGKAYKPTDPGVVQQLILELRSLIGKGGLHGIMPLQNPQPRTVRTITMALPSR